MIKKLLSKLGLGVAAQSQAGASGLHEPYRASHVNFLYNLLFCDDLALFKTGDAVKGGGPWATLLADQPDLKALEAIAANEKEESRVRALAYHRLRAAGRDVPRGKLLGVIVEVPVDGGLDVLAAFADGRVRFLSHSEKVAIFEEGAAPEVEALAKELVAVSQTLVDQIGPWDRERLPPPHRGHVRMSFLVSDGLYLGEGPFDALASDAMGGPVLAKATQLLHRVVDAATE